MKFDRMKQHILRGYYLEWLTWKDEKLSLIVATLDSSLSPALRQQVIRIGLVISVFAIGIVGVLQNSLYTLRIALGSVLMLALLRYHYALLLAWVLIITLIGTIPLFAGNNFLTGLIAPTLLLMTCMPIKQTFKRMPALGFLLIFFLWVFASISITPLSIGAFLTLWIIFLAYVAIGVLAINVITTRRRVTVLIDAMLLPGTIIALYGIYGYITKQNGDSTTASASLFRIHSIFHSAPSLALFLSLLVPLTFYCILTSQGFRRIIYSVLVLILLLATVLTFTRDALISLPLSLLIMIFFLPSRKMRTSMLAGSFLLVALIVLVAVVGNLPIFDRFFSQDLATLNGRTITWQLLLTRFDPTQLLGKGLEASDTLLASFQVSNVHGVIPTASHSIFIEALYDQGIIGVTLLSLVFIVLLISLVKGILKSNGEHRMLYAAALAVLIVTLFESFASNDFWIEDFSVYFWIIMALPFALCWQTPKHLPQTIQETIIDDELTEPRITAIQQREPDKVLQLHRGASNFMQQRMRICFVSLKFSPIVGGTEVQAEKQARQLQALGHRVTVVTLRLDRAWKQTETLKGLPIVRIGGIYRRGGLQRIGRLGHFPSDFGMFLTLWRLRDSYDIIHVFQLSSLSAVAALIGKLLSKPVIINIQTAGPGEPQRRRLEGGAALMTDTLTTTSFAKIDTRDLAVDDITDLPQKAVGGRIILNFLRKSNAFYQILSTRGYSYLTSNGFRAGQIVHIPGSVDTDKFRSGPERWPDSTKPERNIICVARLDYAKGIDVLLHAWGRMMHSPPQWRNHLKPTLHLVGDGKLKPQLEYIVTELGIQDSVKFLGLRRDIVDLLQQSWGFVLPSRWEGMPNALLEAMACGLPCIATRVSGSEDVISDGVNGLLVEPEQPEAMAQALRRLIENSDLAQRFGKEARATVLHGYQLLSVVEQCVELYRRLLANNKSTYGERWPQQEMPQPAIPVEALQRMTGGE